MASLQLMSSPPRYNYVYQQLNALGLSNRLAMEVSQNVKVASYEAQQVVWSKGAEVDSLQLIISGLITEFVPAVKIKSTFIDLFWEGRWFGEQHVINGTRSMSDYVCLVPTDVLKIPVATVRQILDVDLGFTRRMLELSAWRNQNTLERLVLVRHGNPSLRIVVGLSLFAEAQMHYASRSTVSKVPANVEVFVSQSLLASLFGVSRTLFSNVLHTLCKHKLLYTSYKKIVFVSLDAWGLFAKRHRSTRMTNFDPSIEEILQLFNNG